MHQAPAAEGGHGDVEPPERPDDIHERRASKPVRPMDEGYRGIDEGDAAHGERAEKQALRVAEHRRPDVAEKQIAKGGDGREEDEDGEVEEEEDGAEGLHGRSGVAIGEVRKEGGDNARA